MITVKCDICGKEFQTKDDKDRFAVCDDCKSVQEEFVNGKGGE